jgi:hypothetical protein
MAILGRAAKNSLRGTLRVGGWDGSNSNDIKRACGSSSKVIGPLVRHWDQQETRYRGKSGGGGGFKDISFWF